MTAPQTGYLLLFSKSLSYGATEYGQAARYDRGWLAPDGEETLVTPATHLPPQTWETVAARATAIHALNPSQQIGLYDGSAAFSRHYEAGYVFSEDADLFHDPAGTALTYNAGNITYRFPNLAAAGVRAEMIAEYVAHCQAYGFDGGIMWDSWTPSQYSGYVTASSGDPHFDLDGGCLESPIHLQATWEKLLAVYSLEMQQAMEAAGMRLYLNGLGYSSADTFLGTYQSNTANYGSGVLHEHVHRMYKSATLFDQGLTMTRLAVANGAEVLWYAAPDLFKNTNPDGGGGSTIAYTVDNDLRRFYWASYLLVQGPKTYYGFYPYGAGVAYTFASAAYVDYDDIYDLAYGIPTGRSYQTTPETLRWREYSRGFAVVNPTSTEQAFRRPGSYRVWDPVSGSRITVAHNAPYYVPAYTGLFLFHHSTEAIS